MYRRRHNLYSRIEAFQEGRRAVWEIIGLVFGLGLLINLISDPISTQIDVWIDDSWDVAEISLFALASAIIFAISYFFLRSFFERIETQRVQVELRLPYLMKHKQGIQLPKPNVEYDSFYYVPTHVSLWFNQTLPFQRKANQAIEAKWRELKAGANPPGFNIFMKENHAWLVDVALLHALLDYGKKSLGASSNYYWEHSQLDSYSLTINSLFTDLFTDNPFVQDKARRSGEQKLHLPVDVQLKTFADADGWRRWKLNHHKYGELNIRISPFYRVLKNETDTQFLQQVGEIRDVDEFWVMSARIDMQASFKLKMNGLQAVQFHDWLTRLLAFLEESLDWNYYLKQRLDRITLSLPEIIGGDKQLWELQEQLKQIQQQLAVQQQNLENQN